MKKSKIIVMDGHDCSGKTTLAHLVAKELNGKYVKPYADSLGDLIAWATLKEKYNLANELSLAAVERQIDENRGVDCLIFDRHWLSMFTVLPEDFHQRWHPLPITFLCWADLETTNHRMHARGEIEKNPWCNEYYCKCYKEYALKYNIPIIDTSGTSSAEQKLQEILVNLKPLLLEK